MSGSCDGANPIVGLSYAYIHGSVAQATYPYRQRDGPCRLPNPKIPARWHPANICYAQMKGDDSSYGQILDAYGPILVAVAMNGNVNNYESGIYDDAKSCGTEVNHAVVSRKVEFKARKV